MSAEAVARAERAIQDGQEAEYRRALYELTAAELTRIFAFREGYAAARARQEADAPAPRRCRRSDVTDPCGGEPATDAEQSHTPTTRRYRVRDEEGIEEDFTADDLAGAHRMAEAWVREGDYDEIETTEEVAYWLVPVVDGEPDEEAEERGTVRIDPPEPECRRGEYGLPGEHDWEDGQPWGDGGGVKGTDTCRRCGLLRHWGTWDSRHDRPGRSVRYERED